MAGGFEKMTATEFRSRNNGMATKPSPQARTIFTQEVYEATSGEFVIEIEPMGAPRVNKGSQWNKSKSASIERYHALRDKIRDDCATMGYRLGGVLNLRFELSMPESWSAKKKASTRGTAHQSKPDLDNMIKAFCDSFAMDDSHVHTITASKIWTYKGRIVIIR